MDEEHSVTVKSEVDVITARMYVRDVARGLGMNLGDQARISLAASSLAHAIGLGRTHQGQIEISCVHERDDARVGVQVICIRIGLPCTLEAGRLGEARWMVDELMVEERPPDELQVTVIKWLV
ncbi:MAG: hypothetical protein JW850_23275 [Thermoflexales bacterium]|nr:hypothetical protein [Thermoflexales bacterium]